MRLRSVIIDDEETGIEILKLLIEKHTPNVKVVGEAVRAKEGIELIESYLPEIVFLDISMPEMDGFEMLEKLSWKKFKLVFTTAYQEHALRALKLNATDYLLKPVDYKDLIAVVERIKQQAATAREGGRAEYGLLNSLQRFTTQKLPLNSKHGVEFIDPSDILYLESRSNYTLVQLSSSEPVLTPKTLREFEQQLCNNSNFMRVHHSYIINLHKVTRYMKDQDSILMNNEHRIPLSKKRKDSFFKWLEL